MDSNLPVNLGNFIKGDAVFADGRTAVADKVPFLALGTEDGGLGAFGLEV